MGPSSSSRPSISCFPGCDISSPIVFTTAPTCVTPSRNSLTGQSRSASAPLPASNCCRAAGSSNDPSPGSIGTAAWQRSSRLRSRAPKPGFTSPPRSCSLGDCPAHNTTSTIKIRTLTAEDYPDLNADGAISTVAVGNVLAVYNWPAGTERYRKVTRFVRAFFERLHDLQAPPHHALFAEFVDYQKRQTRTLNSSALPDPRLYELIIQHVTTPS